MKNRENYLNQNHQDSDSKRLFDNLTETTRWLNTSEAANYLGLKTANALRILVHRGRVKAYKLGSRLKFHLNDLNKALQRKKENPYVY